MLETNPIADLPATRCSFRLSRVSVLLRAPLVPLSAVQLLAILAALLAFSASALPAAAQSSDRSGGWSTGTQLPGQVPGAPDGATGTTTVIPRQPPAQTAAPAVVDPQSALLTLEAYLTGEISGGIRNPITRGLVWRVFTLGGGEEGAKLVMTRRDAAPTIKLAPGRYAINAAFGRANLTQMISVEAGRQSKETFILNAGGLRVITKVAGGTDLAGDTARYEIYSDERDQSGERRRVVTNARPGLITRLNSGIYHIVSRLGDANALVSAEVAVEAGKLTEAVVSHEAAKVTFKLVATKSGEAQADTQWVIMTKTGDIVKETAGALPTHVLAPGSYTVSARFAGKLFTRTFELKSGDVAEIEVMMQ